MENKPGFRILACEEKVRNGGIRIEGKYDVREICWPLQLSCVLECFQSA